MPSCFKWGTLETLRKPQLKYVCEELGLTSEGKIKDLQERLNGQYERWKNLSCESSVTNKKRKAEPESVNASDSLQTRGNDYKRTTAKYEAVVRKAGPGRYLKSADLHGAALQDFQKLTCRICTATKTMIKDGIAIGSMTNKLMSTKFRLSCTGVSRDKRATKQIKDSTNTNIFSQFLDAKGNHIEKYTATRSMQAVKLEKQCKNYMYQSIKDGLRKGIQEFFDDLKDKAKEHPLYNVLHVDGELDYDIELTYPTKLLSTEKGDDQAAHTDYRLDKNSFSVSMIIPREEEGCSLIGWPGSCEVINQWLKQTTAVKKRKILQYITGKRYLINRDEFAIWRHDFVHAGDVYDEKNQRIFFYVKFVRKIRRRKRGKFYTKKENLAHIDKNEAYPLGWKESLCQYFKKPDQVFTCV